MKKYYLIFIASILAFSVHSQAEGIIGIWEGVDDEDTIQISFDTDGYVVFSMGNEILGGPSYDIDGVEASLTYKMDVSQTPYWIDFIIVIKNDDSEFDMMKGILEFSEDKIEMRICLNFDAESERPESFMEDETLLMTRLK